MSRAAIALVTTLLAAACAPAPPPPLSVRVLRDHGATAATLALPLRGEPVADARATLRALGVEASALGEPRVHTWRGRTTVAFPQLHRGVPVRGGGAVVRLDRLGRPALVHERLVTGLMLDPALAPTREEAARRMAEALPAASLHPTLVVVPDARGGHARWVATATTSAPPERWRVTFDAAGVRLSRASHTAQGRVYPLHPLAGDPEEVTLSGLPDGAPELTSPLADVWSASWTDGAYAKARHAVADEAGDFLYDPAPWDAPDPFAEVNAYHHVERALSYFTERFGVTLAAPASVLVNYEESPGEGYSNAYAYLDTGDLFVTVFGHTEDLDFAYSGPIAAHEIGHPFFDLANDTAEHSDYPVNIDAEGFHSAPTALNEGMSDYWAGVITGEVDLMAYLSTGEDLERSVRHLEGTPRCPDDLIGEAHLDGPLISTALWELRGLLGDAVDEVAWALIHQLAGAPTFADAAAIVQQAVADLEADGVLPAGSAQIAAQVLAARGLDVCGRSVPLTAGLPRTGTAIGADTVAKALGLDQGVCSALRLIGARVPLVVSYVATVPEEPVGGLELTMALERLDGAPLEDGDVLYEVVLRRGAPAQLALVPLEFGGASLSIVNGVEAADAVRDGSPTTVTVTDLELEPGATLHINVLSAHCRSMRHQTTLKWLPPAPPEPDAGPAEDAAGDATDDAPEVHDEPDVGARVDAADAGAGDLDVDTAGDDVVPHGPDAQGTDAAAPSGTASDGCRAASPGAPPVALTLMALWVFAATRGRRRVR